MHFINHDNDWIWDPYEKCWKPRSTTLSGFYLLSLRLPSGFPPWQTSTQGDQNWNKATKNLRNSDTEVILPKGKSGSPKSCRQACSSQILYKYWDGNAVSVSGSPKEKEKTKHLRNSRHRSYFTSGEIKEDTLKEGKSLGKWDSRWPTLKQ